MHFAQDSPGPQSQSPIMLSMPPRRRGPPTPLRIDTPAHKPDIALAVGDSSASTSTLSSAASDTSEYSLPFAATNKPRFPRNMKKLSLTLPSAQSSSSSLLLPQFEPQGPPRDTLSLENSRRLSIMSLPATSATTSLLHRKEEDGSPSIPYQDGPIQVIPGVWLGSEDNARDWKALVERGVKSILNVAKEVVSPFDSASSQPLRPFSSTPNLNAVPKSTKSTYYPAHLASGRPGMHYLKLQWSHGQSDLVQEGFPAAMTFVDAALDRGEGVLIHCQCGISRSATLMIAIVMRAAALSLPSVPSEVWDLKGYQGAYSFVKGKSRWIGPNMSLIYQLLDYDRTLKSDGMSPGALSDRSSTVAEEEEEWGRRRRQLDEGISSGEVEVDRRREESGCTVDQQEAQALDKAMEDRIIARNSSASSLSSTASSGVGMGSTWRTRYGSCKRTPSIASNRTSRSILSEDLVEEEEEQQLLGVGGGFEDESVRRKAKLTVEGDESYTSSSSMSADDGELNSTSLPLATPRAVVRPATRYGPSAPASKASFGLLHSHVTASKSAFEPACELPRRQSTTRKPSLEAPPRPTLKTKMKRRPPPLGLLPPVPPSPNATVPVAPPSVPLRLRTESRKPAPPPLHLRAQPKFSSQQKSQTRCQRARTPSQTLFVFPPSPTLTQTPSGTPSTMTLTSNLNNSIPFPAAATPRVTTFTSHQRTRSFIGLGGAPTPTTACSIVDARGWISAAKEKMS